MSVGYLTKEKGDELKTHAKSLSLWLKLSDNHILTRSNIVEWNPNEEKYS